MSPCALGLAPHRLERNFLNKTYYCSMCKYEITVKAARLLERPRSRAPSSEESNAVRETLWLVGELSRLSRKRGHLVVQA